MTRLQLQVEQGRAQTGVKGPRAAEWLAAQGLTVPAAPNTYSAAVDMADEPVVARLGSSEFFLEQGQPGDVVRRVTAATVGGLPGVYPILREDCAWSLQGAGAEEMLAEVCNINFAALDVAARPVIMTLMIGVAVLVLPLGSAELRRYRIWCDPTYGHSLGEALEGVVVDCGGTYLGVTA
jgi:sarcosine oxidase, subunit gamma